MCSNIIFAISHHCNYLDSYISKLIAHFNYEKLHKFLVKLYITIATLKMQVVFFLIVSELHCSILICIAKYNYSAAMSVAVPSYL